MVKVQLVVNVDSDAAECMKQRAARYGTSVSRLVECYFELLVRPPSSRDRLLRWARRGVTPDEALDRTARLAFVVGIAEGVLGSRVKARRWLVKPNPALTGAVPLEQLADESGMRQVEAILGRIAHGVVS